MGIGLTEPERLIRTNLGVSGLLIGLLGGAWWISDSQLALAQAADALTDAVVTIALLWSLRIARTPPDEEHPLGHQDAEPLGALVAAAAAAALAVEVVQSAMGAIASGAVPELSLPVAAIFLTRILLRAGVLLAAGRAHARSPRSPSLAALRLDARNDVLVAGLALLGFAFARFGWHGLDAWLAIPLGVWIALSGVELARDNIRLLMGTAPDPARQAELLAGAAEVPGVMSAKRVRAAARGSQLLVLVEVTADPELSLREVHDLEERLIHTLEREEDVAEALAHVEPAPV